MCALMKGFVANVDRDWFESLRSLETPPDEVNLWRAGSERFRALAPGEPLFFKLKAPDNAIAGLGFFAHFSLLPLSFAWSLAGVANGVATRAEMVERLASMRARAGPRGATDPDPKVGSIFTVRPVLFADEDRVAIPEDFASTVGQGKLYELGRGDGRRIWQQCMARSGGGGDVATIRDRAGAPTLALPRLGRLSFQAAVLDAWGRRCAITGEGAIAALGAARIREYGDGRDWAIDNGVLLRADLRGLFEAGYLSISDDYRVRVSPRIAADGDSGAAYLELDGRAIHVPKRRANRPSIEALWWHREKRFLK